VPFVRPLKVVSVPRGHKGGPGGVHDCQESARIGEFTVDELVRIVKEMPRRRGTPELMRGLNRSIVVDAVRQHGTLSRADLVRFTSISPASVSAIVADLIQEGLVREVGRAPADVGRPGRLIQFSDNVLFLGCDLASAEGFRVGLMRLSGELVESQVLAVPARPPSPELVGRSLAEFVAEAASRMASDRIVGAGIGVPGVVNPATGYVEIAPLLGWADVELGEPLSDYLGMPVCVDNDVTFALGAEVDRGAASRASDVILVTFAEGVGGAVLLDGKIYRGRGAAGEIAYVVTETSGARQALDGIGMFEGRLFELVAEDARRDGIDPAQCEEQTARLVHLLEQSRGSVKFSEDIEAQLVGTIAAALTSSIALLDPEVVLLSGWIELAGVAMLDRIIEQVRRLIHRMPAMQFSSVGDDRVVIGAALAASRTTLADVHVVEEAI
jgi:predicted NBD/HSP70 family sugar kinase